MRTYKILAVGAVAGLLISPAANAQHGNNGRMGVAAGIGGIVGALLGSALSQPSQPTYIIVQPPQYAPPPQQAYAAPPVQYSPPPYAQPTYAVPRPIPQPTYAPAPPPVHWAPPPAPAVAPVAGPKPASWMPPPEEVKPDVQEYENDENGPEANDLDPPKPVEHSLHPPPGSVPVAGEVPRAAPVPRVDISTTSKANCRPFESSMRIGSQTVTTKGTVCKNATGDWEMQK